MYCGTHDKYTDPKIPQMQWPCQASLSDGQRCNNLVAVCPYYLARGIAHRAEPSRCGFYDLPLEIRNAVYYELIERAKKVLISKLSLVHPQKD